MTQPPVFWKRWLGAPPLAVAADRLHRRTDELTGLATRAAMDDALDAALRSRLPGVVVMLDIDNFKYFNERHGHDAGDALLVAVTARLRGPLASASCLARVGSDRFVALLPELTLVEAMRQAQECVAALREPVGLAGGSEIVTLSAGVATLASPSVADTWRACDAALHAAKARGRDRVVAFDDDTRQVVVERRNPASTLIELQERSRALREEARTDALTGLHNRLALDEMLHAVTVAGEGERRRTSVAIAVIGVDHFDDYHHAHGDAAGDEALRAVAQAIKSCAREADLVFHKGGEEFVVVLRGAESDAAVAAAERMRAAVEALALPHAAASAGPAVTVTIGVAAGSHASTLRQLLDAAAEMAMAGRVGGRRNQVHAARLREVGAPALSRTAAPAAPAAG